MIEYRTYRGLDLEPEDVIDGDEDESDGTRSETGYEFGSLVEDEIDGMI